RSEPHHPGPDPGGREDRGFGNGGPRVQRARLLRHGARRHHRRRGGHPLGAGGEHGAGPDRALAAAGRGPCRGYRIRRAVPAPGRPRGGPPRPARRTDGLMKFRRRSSVLPRAPWPNSLERTEPLRGQVWTRAASVQPQLPGTVVVQVSEWEPVASYHAGPSTRLFLLSSQAIVLGTISTRGGLVDVQGPAGNDPRVRDRALDPQLLTALVNMQRVFPTLVGQDVAGFIFDSCGDLTLVAKRGWKVYFGRVLTPEEFATLRDELTALKAI